MEQEDSALSLLGRIVLNSLTFQGQLEEESDDEEIPELEDPEEDYEQSYYRNPIEQWTLERVESDEDDVLPFPLIDDSTYVTLEEWQEGKNGMVKTVDIGFTRNYSSEKFWTYDANYHF